MNTIEDDLRTLLRLQADAMRVPSPILDQPLARVTSLGSRRETRWLLPAAAAALVAVGVGALAERNEAQVDPTTAPSASAFVFESPTVRLRAESIEVTVADKVFVPRGAAVHSDLGDAESTSLELTWFEQGVEQRIYFTFASDGTSWWADRIMTYNGTSAGDWLDSPEGEDWFTSPLGTTWMGDLALPNLRIRNMSLEAFRRPASCDNPTSPVAVVAAYSTIEGPVGSGWSGHIDLIDTASCTPVDPGPYTFTVLVERPSIAIVADDALLDTSTTIVGGDPESAAVASTTRFGFSLSFLMPGSTTVRVIVADDTGTVIGTSATPVNVRPA